MLFGISCALPLLLVIAKSNTADAPENEVPQEEGEGFPGVVIGGAIDCHGRQ